MNIEQRIQDLEKENAELKRELEERQGVSPEMKCCVCNKSCKLYPLPGDQSGLICGGCLKKVAVCCVCRERIGTLELDDERWECENCAQVMSELAPD